MQEFDGQTGANEGIYHFANAVIPYQAPKTRQGSLVLLLLFLRRACGGRLRGRGALSRRLGRACRDANLLQRGFNS